jgi:hypothetical protein
VLAGAVARPFLRASCGPLEITVTADDVALIEVAQNYFSLYAPPWESRTRAITIEMTRHDSPIRASGTFLTCGNMQADRLESQYVAHTKHGFVAEGHTGSRRDVWVICVPPQTLFGEPEIGDIEDLFSLVCTAAWREEGWIALHAGAIAKNSTCALLCAPSGGGKSTLTAALVRNGWSTLGDDKLLLRRNGGEPRIHALLQTFNLDPATRRWFDVGDLDALPRYSAWTNKRRVSVGVIAAGTAVRSARPTHVVRIVRNPKIYGMRATPMSGEDLLPALLRQIVLPRDRAVCHWILSETGKTARGLCGVRLEIGDDAYSTPYWLAAIENALLCRT